MWKALKRRWKYFTARMAGRFEENADPKIQMEQAITEAREQHRRLKDQAANVIANHKQTEIRLNRALSELERVNRNARQAIMMAEEAAGSDDTAKADSYTTAAEQLAGRLISLEDEIEGLKGLLFQTSEAADQAKAAVSQNSLSLQEKLSERQKLLGQLDQARMQEQMNEAMTTLSESVGEDVPTLAEVREKIESRYAKAKGAAELVEQGSSEGRMLEIEAAARNQEAKARLSQIREQLGFAASSPPEIPQSTPAKD
ncbi:MAG: PspA/IM30 family protein [Acidimicrobiaceae bacterium]|nr:PspA/IM30 family protein [Acidimicrobiaceae bacterium]MCY4280509.1 PspA/IM30 family protein [Acidimicrobiaceae bacterium]